MIDWSRGACAVLFASLALFAGCVTDDGTSTTTGGFPWVTDPLVPAGRGDLKNASRLDLTYARWQEQIGNISEAEQSYRRALADDPQSIEACLGLARLDQWAGRTAEAERSLRKLHEAHHDDAGVLAALGQFYAVEKRWDESIDHLKRAAEAAPNVPVYRHQYAVALGLSGDMTRAFAEFASLHGEAEAHYSIACIHYGQGRSDRAEQELQQSLALRPDLSAARTMLNELHRGRQVSAVQDRHDPAGATIQTSAIRLPMSERRIVMVAAADSAASENLSTGDETRPDTESR